ncbi:flagellin/flagellar hook associated protein [Halobacteroides halobius DSM 5150]|uniref:Flagellin n=1 Tax=Halobacteroides halobius (strain ATCC 35273 / DSM 5150 / MD-1) TaxID=748449 RepID=L0KCM6_HALHC|nr:flagellin [Halobacteroides halobius]AGB42144.1 flagellin/flagellar hook associated protein [Halobacteroides halobius DSM 5150]
MRINTNISALNAYNQLQNTNSAMSDSLEKLSSGLRINKAADDAAGLAISEKMESQIKGLSQAQQNAQDGISMIQTAEGALKETHSILQRMRELSVQAANDSNTKSDRKEIQKEMTQLSHELDRIAETTEFNTKKLLDGSQEDKSQVAKATVSGNTTVTINSEVEFNGEYEVSHVGTTTSGIVVENSFGEVVAKDTGATSISFDGVKFDASSVNANTASTVTVTAGQKTAGTDNSVTFQIGANQGQDTEISIRSMKAEDLNVGTGTISVTTQKNAEQAISVLDQAINKVSNERAKLGAQQNRFEHTINNLSASEENLTAARSRIRDTDMAKQMMELSKQRIMRQAGTAMLAQANQKPQAVMQLLG